MVARLCGEKLESPPGMNTEWAFQEKEDMLDISETRLSKQY